MCVNYRSLGDENRQDQKADDGGSQTKVSLFVQFILQAEFQLRTDFTDLHPGAHHEFTTQHLVGFIFVGKFADHPAILAILIPTKSSVRDGFRTEVLKAPENCVFFGDLERFSQNLDLYEPFIGPKNLAANTVESSGFNDFRLSLMRCSGFWHDGILRPNRLDETRPRYNADSRWCWLKWQWAFDPGDEEHQRSPRL
jgi:hypothetical protein